MAVFYHREPYEAEQKTGCVNSVILPFLMANNSDKDIVIFDLDGTLALIEHRRYLVTGENKNWDEFYQQCVNDKPNISVVATCQALQQQEYTIVIMSGRSAAVKDETLEWLYRENIYFWALFMRDVNDYTPDLYLKRKWFQKYINSERVLAIFDDRHKVVDMWRSEGLTCFQVAPGNF